MKNNNDLFYTCSLIEYIGRTQKLERAEVVKAMGEETISQIYHYADVFHCEMIEKTAADFIERCQIPKGNYDNVADCKYTVPDYWTMGEVYERLIEDVCGDQEEQLIKVLMEVYSSWLSAELCNYNSDLYYQPRDYLYECYKEGRICD